MAKERIINAPLYLPRFYICRNIEFVYSIDFRVINFICLATINFRGKQSNWFSFSRPSNMPFDVIAVSEATLFVFQKFQHFEILSGWENELVFLIVKIIWA